MQAEPRGTMHGWIWRANLLPFAETIADLVRCRLDDGALTAGIEGSDADDDSWFTFVLDGQPRVEMHFARTRTDDTVLVDVELDGIDKPLEIRTALLLDVCNRYRLTPEAG
ncbi:hypothetical protein Pth03_32210 [Planotetraspora thailandica]|uniref:Uncharacterized protein n=1 Tax=Planotetraspora thailandica TaxID=487172 RepID=A0A8J3XTX7_9ACTN|nr:hypothetical protein [Planotetraspora thailandica]GII54832.1 hypothetical protein Pth03_32210 [Planotetraspora thailandica]